MRRADWIMIGLLFLLGWVCLLEWGREQLVVQYVEPSPAVVEQATPTPDLASDKP